MGRHFDDNPGFQPKITPPKDFSRQCIVSGKESSKGEMKAYTTEIQKGRVVVSDCHPITGFNREVWTQHPRSGIISLDLSKQMKTLQNWGSTYTPLYRLMAGTSE